MITLPNGDKWILGDVEQIAAGFDDSLLKEVPVEDFLQEWLSSGNFHCLRKHTNEFPPDGYWDANFDPYKEILGSLAINLIETFFGQVYEMPNGKVYAVYESADSGGYDVCVGVKEFENWDDYVKHVSCRTK